MNWVYDSSTSQDPLKFESIEHVELRPSPLIIPNELYKKHMFYTYAHISGSTGAPYAIFDAFIVKFHD